MAADIVADTKELDRLAADMIRVKRQIIGRLGERGYQLLRSDIKQNAYETGNLMQGVAPPEVDYENLEAVITVSARSAATGGGQATVFGADGKERKKVSLKPQPAFNYAAQVALGNKAATLRPKTAGAFLIPVPTAPSGESYLVAGGQIFIFRRSRKGQKPNPFHERAGAQLEKEAPGIADAVLAKFFN
jgi:hypothetical protein